MPTKNPIIQFYYPLACSLKSSQSVVEPVWNFQRYNLTRIKRIHDDTTLGEFAISCATFCGTHMYTGNETWSFILPLEECLKPFEANGATSLLNHLHSDNARRRVLRSKIDGCTKLVRESKSTKSTGFWRNFKKLAKII